MESLHPPPGTARERDNQRPPPFFEEALHPSGPLSECDYEGDNERTDYESSSFLSSDIEHSSGSDVDANYDPTDGEPTDSGYDADYGRTDDNSTDGIVEDDYGPTGDAPPPRRGFFQTIYDTARNACRGIVSMFWKIVDWVKSLFAKMGEALRPFMRRTRVRVRIFICSFQRSGCR